MKKVNKRKWMILLSILTILIVPLNKSRALSFANLDGDTMAIYGDNVRIKNQPNTETNYYWRWDDNTVNTNAMGLDIYFHATQDTTIYKGETINFSVAVFSYRQNESPLQASGAILMQGATTMQCTTTLGTTTNMILGNGTGINETNNLSSLNISCTPANNMQITRNNNDMHLYINMFSSSYQNISIYLAKTYSINERIMTNYEEKMYNEDLSNSAKQQPDQQNYDNVHTFEEGVFNDLEDPNILSLIDLGIDPETNTWIWNTMTGIFNANVRVMSMVISVLTLGLAKFLMGR